MGPLKWISHRGAIRVRGRTIFIWGIKSRTGGTTTVITTLNSEKTSYSSASVIWIFKTNSGKFGVT